MRVGALVFSPARDAVLLVEHAGIWTDTPFWTPPGGGVDFGESLPEALEETGLDVEAGPLRYVLDFVRPPLHAVSFYFESAVVGGQLEVGADPELEQNQLIRGARWVPLAELDGIALYPEGLAGWLRRDVPLGFPDGTRWLGTLR